MAPKHNENDDFDIQLSSKVENDCVRNKTRMEINVERRCNGLRSHYGNDNDDGIEKGNALSTTTLTFKEACATKNCNKSTFAGTRSSVNSKHTSIPTSSSVKAPAMFLHDAVIQNDIVSRNDDLAVNAPLPKQQGIIRKEYMNHRRASLTVASKKSRKKSSVTNKKDLNKSSLEIKMENDLLQRSNEKELDNFSISPLRNKDLFPINLDTTKNGRVKAQFGLIDKKNSTLGRKLSHESTILKNNFLEEAYSCRFYNASTPVYEAQNRDRDFERSEQNLPHSCSAISTKHLDTEQRCTVPPPILFVPIWMPPVINPPSTLLGLIKSHVSSEKASPRQIETNDLTKIEKLKKRFKRKRKDEIIRSAVLSEKILLRRGSKFVPRHRVKADLHRIKRRRRNFLCNWFEVVIKYSTATLGRKLDTFGDKHNYKYFPSATVHKMVHGFDPIERKIEHEDGAGERNIVPSCMEHIRQSYAMQCKIGFYRKSSVEDVFTVPKDDDEDDLVSNTFSGNNDFIYVVVGLTNIFIMQFIMAIVIFFVKG